MTLRSLLYCLLICLTAPGAALAETAPFDLAGPTLKVKVTHAGVTLPIGQVPNLSPGDQISIAADLPAAQSVHYLLVAAFLQGATNPPPESWFYKAETWTRKGQGGLRITVPKDAQQVVVFLAPQTGGDFGTLMGAVRGRPGAFVRASQDLNQASLDRGRLDAFVAAVRKQDPTADPDRLKTVSPLLARSLTIKLNTDCFQKMADLQASCLMAGQDSLVLNDGHSTSIVEALTSGNVQDLALQLSATPQAGYGFNSPYIGAVSDIARILDSFHTAQYQYIPALTTVRDDRMKLVLNTPPSFHNPLSVLVTALPAIEPAQSPPLQPVDPKTAYCAESKDLVLPVDGAPLAYSTGYAHDMVLQVKTRDGKLVELPVKADAEKGGFIIDTKDFNPSQFDDEVEGNLKGAWGFEPFDGPAFHLQTSRSQPWRLTADDEQALVVGRDDVVHLEGRNAACVDGVALQQPSGDPQAIEWKAVEPHKLAVTLPLANAQAGPLTLMIKRHGASEPDTISLKSFTQAGHLDSFTLHTGDPTGVLKGNRLDEVANLSLGGVDFKPGALATIGGGDELSMTPTNPDNLGRFKPGQSATALVTLKDGRTVKLRTVVAPLRPSVTLIAKNAQAAAPASRIAIELADADELPQDALLTFSIHAQRPATFSRRASVEVATTDGAASTTLTIGSGLTLEDNQVAVATLDTAKAFGASGYGAIQFRIVDGGFTGDWMPLATLVRLPVLQGLKCGESRARTCELSGSNLFLIDSLSNEAAFEHPIKVPEGFPGSSLQIPRPANGRLYLKLHDAPKVVNQVKLTFGEKPGTLAANTRRPGD